MFKNDESAGGQSITESDHSRPPPKLEITRMSIPSSANQVLLGKRMKLSGDLTISKTLLKETINWTLQPLDSKVDLTKMLNHQREAPQESSSGPKIFLAPPEDESCLEDRRLVIDT